MIEVYNEVLRVASERKMKWWEFGFDQPPNSMPEYRELMAAIDRADRLKSALNDVTADPTLKSSLARIVLINRMVQEHALGPGINSGEILCPECKKGSLCYLVSEGKSLVIECSTLGCLSWDIRT